MNDILSQREIDESAKIVSYFLEGEGTLEMLEPIDPDIRRHLITVAMAYLCEHGDDHLPITDAWLVAVGGNLRMRDGATDRRVDFRNGPSFVMLSGYGAWSVFWRSTFLRDARLRREAKWILSFFGAIEHGKLQSCDPGGQSD